MSDVVLEFRRSAGDPYAVGPALHNDLEAPAIRLRPTLSRTLEIADEFGLKPDGYRLSDAQAQDRALQEPA